MKDWGIRVGWCPHCSAKQSRAGRKGQAGNFCGRLNEANRKMKFFTGLDRKLIKFYTLCFSFNATHCSRD